MENNNLFKSISTMKLKETDQRNTGISGYIRNQLAQIPEDQALAMSTLVKDLLGNKELGLKDMHQAYIRIGNVLKSSFGQNFRKMKDQEDGYTYIAWKEGKGPDSLKAAALPPDDDGESSGESEGGDDEDDEDDEEEQRLAKELEQGGDNE